METPPYVQIQKFPKSQKDKWIAQDYETYAATADIYCLFYEKGAGFLREDGHLCYITSNKWMRAGYGEKLRSYLATVVNTTAALDFGMAQNFGAATTYTCILGLTKEAPTGDISTCYAADDRAAMADPESYFGENSVILNDLGASPWVVLSRQRQRIKELVEEQGMPLEGWDIKINYGIKTGFNDAFYITTEQRDAMIAEDPTCEEIIVPLLRGRYVGRYGTNWDGTWMINTHNGVRSQSIPRIDAKKYSSIWEHLSINEKKLSKRQDKGDHWSNLRNCAYIDEFTKPKIIYPNMTKYLPFYFDHSAHYFGNQKCFIVTGLIETLPYLTAFLNSSLFRCCFKDNFPELLGNTYELSKIFFEKIPVRNPGPTLSSVFSYLVSFIQLTKESEEPNIPGAEQFLEDLIDACVMEVYFREHMAEKDLLLLDDTKALLENYDPDVSETKQQEVLEQLYKTANAPDHPIRNRLLRLTAESPDLLAVIKEEGKV